MTDKPNKVQKLAGADFITEILLILFGGAFELDIEVVEKEPKETPCARLASFALGES